VESDPVLNRDEHRALASHVKTHFADELLKVG
jgi:hypothetical protein